MGIVLSIHAGWGGVQARSSARREDQVGQGPVTVRAAR
jgi:hypothetical protein